MSTHKYKKYIIFGFDDYYPAGGLADIMGSADTLEEVRELIKQCGYRNHDVVDRDTWEEVDPLMNTLF